MKCVLCDKEATQTAAQIPVCDEHRKTYDEEGVQYLSHRPVWDAMCRAYSLHSRWDAVNELRVKYGLDRIED